MASTVQMVEAHRAAVVVLPMVLVDLVVPEQIGTRLMGQAAAVVVTAHSAVAAVTAACMVVVREQVPV